MFGIWEARANFPGLRGKAVITDMMIVLADTWTSWWPREAIASRQALDLLLPQFPH